MFFSQAFKRSVKNGCFICVVVWLLYHVVCAMLVASLSGLFTMQVMVPMLIGLLLAWGLPKCMDSYNTWVCKKLLRVLSERILAAPMPHLSEEERRIISNALLSQAMLMRVLSYLQSGLRGVVLSKKATEKKRSYQKKSMRLSTDTIADKGEANQQGDGERSHVNFAYAYCPGLPRKMMIAFKDGGNSDMNLTGRCLGISNGYSQLVLDLHVFNKSKTQGGQKRCGDMLSNKTAVGAFKVCEYSDYVSSKSVGVRQAVALRTRGIDEEANGLLRHYRIEPSRGESLARALSRGRVGMKNLHIISMLLQVKQQLKHMHDAQRAHMDLKLENITVSADFQRFTVIDFPDGQSGNTPASGHKTPWFGQLSNMHELLSQVIPHNQYRFFVDCEQPPVMCQSLVSYAQRQRFEALVANFEGRALRALDKECLSWFFLKANKNAITQERYIDVTSHTVFHDAWAMLYVAFIVSGFVREERPGASLQEQIFTVMEEMFRDYSQWWQGRPWGAENKQACTQYMNEHWSLDSITAQLLKGYVWEKQSGLEKAVNSWLAMQKK